MYARAGATPPRSATLRPNICADVDARPSRRAARPTKPTAPPSRAMEIAVRIDCSVPTASMHGVRALAAGQLPHRGDRLVTALGTTSVAPNRRAMAVRASCRPSAMIRSAPSRWAASTPHRPTAPSPTTATVRARAHPGGERGVVAGRHHVGQREDL